MKCLHSVSLNLYSLFQLTEELMRDAIYMSSALALKTETIVDMTVEYGEKHAAAMTNLN